MPSTDRLLSLARFALQFSRIDRATFHEDGERRETDADHTVMLAVIACAIARNVYPVLDVGKVAQYAIVHDMVEVYAGDTDIFGFRSDGKEQKAKKEREHAALEKVASEFNDVYWIVDTITQYEALGDREARFVKTLDKLMPKLTHLLNNMAAYKKKNRTREEIEAFLNDQRIAMAKSYGAEFPELIDVLRILNNTILDSIPMHAKPDL